MNAAREVLSSARFAQSLATLIMVVVLGAHGVRALIGWPGFIAALATLLALAVAAVVAQPELASVSRTYPLSIIALAALIVASVIWSQYTWATVGGIALALTVLALSAYLSLARDLFQVVRAVGAALRVLLGASLFLEVLSGVILDTPFRWIGIEGDLALGGPIQGVAGSRNALALLGALAVVTFWIEWRTRSVSRSTAIVSLSLAGATLLFARSPVATLVLAVVLIAGLALMGLRRMQPAGRRAAQGALLGFSLLGLAVAWFFRTSLVERVDAAADVEARTSTWAAVQTLIAQQPVLGWGWVGQWPTEVFPFAVVRDAQGVQPDSALNAFVDIGLQLGLAGLIVLTTALGLAFVRAWLVAVARPSTMHVWPALMIVVLGSWSLTESAVLFEGGLLLFATAATAAARSLSWRRRLTASEGGRAEPPTA
jgi:hypothetical protein